MTGDVTPERRQQAADQGVAEAGESVHLPEPSFLPVLVALGATLALVGIVIAWPISAIGVLITVVAVVRWIRAAREEMAELPLEH